MLLGGILLRIKDILGKQKHIIILRLQIPMGRMTMQFFIHTGTLRIKNSSKYNKEALLDQQHAQTGNLRDLMTLPKWVYHGPH